MWSQRLVVGVAVALIALIVLSALGSSDHATPRSGSTALNTTTANVSLSVPQCKPDDLTLGIELRSPSHRQNTGVFAVRSRRPVATVVMRNASNHSCFGGSAFDFKIFDRNGKMIGWWDDIATWFIGDYRPSGFRTLSLPAVYHCDRPGPFTAVAKVGGYTARRHGLRLRDITC